MPGLAGVLEVSAAAARDVATVVHDLSIVRRDLVAGSVGDEASSRALMYLERARYLLDSAVIDLEISRGLGGPQ